MKTCAGVQDNKSHILFLFSELWSGLRNTIFIWRENFSLSEPFRFRARTVERGKIWEEIANRLNEATTIHFRATKRSTREHFNLLFEKFKAKRKKEVQLSGVAVEDSELDIAMEEIMEKMSGG